MSSQPGGATDFSARLQAALGKAKGQTATAAVSPTAEPVTAPSDDQFKQRLSTAMSQARGEPLEAAEAEPAAAISGPVGQGEYVARVGDCMASIAVDHGHFWETLWNDPGNAELQEIRQDPYVLLPGDRVTIPDKRRKDEQIAPELRHRFVRRGAPERLIVKFQVEDKPRANQAYILDVDGKEQEGTTDPEGKIDVFIPPDAMRTTIVFTESDDKYELELGQLDPITETSGVQKRLNNLGFYQGQLDGKMSPDLEQAIRAFQREHEMDVTGELDETTRNKIREVHDV